MNYGGFRLIPCMTVCSPQYNGIVVKMAAAYQIHYHKTICLSAYFSKWVFHVIFKPKIIGNLQREHKLNVAEIGKKNSLYLQQSSGSCEATATWAGTGTAVNNSGKPPSKVAVLLCTMHGQEFLDEQLVSIEQQSHANWVVHASDDGSLDDTHAILERFLTRAGNEKVSIHSGPAQGFARNFLFLTCEAEKCADYYAYADQDDIWESDKLSRAVECLASIPADTPALYCSRTLLVNRDGHPIGLSPLFTRPPSFCNALVQNIGGGNTMVFNEAARNLLKKIGNDTPVVSHDWWAYMVVTGCGGRVFYDSRPTVRYRQHGNNLIGANTDWGARLSRIKWLLRNRFKDWGDINTKALQKIYADLTPENRKIFDLFCKARTRPLLPRLVGLKHAGIYRQTLPGNISLIAAALLNKL